MSEEPIRLPGLRLGAVEGLPWRATRDPGVSWIPLWLAAEEGTQGEDARVAGRRDGATVLIRMEPGHGYRRHRHVGTEEVLVLAGGYRDERGTHPAGSFVHYEPGSAHTPVALGDPERPAGEDNPACILFSCVPDGIELL